MCEPTTMAVLSIVSAVSGVAQQQQAQNAQAESNQNNYNNALQARSENANQINLQRSQAGEAAGQKINDNNLAMRESQASMIARAGPAGLSLDNLLMDMGSKGANYNNSVNQNLDRTNLALDNQLQNVNNNASNTINQLKTPAPVDYLGAGLKIGSAYVNSDLYKTPNSLNGTTSTQVTNGPSSVDWTGAAQKKSWN